MGRILLLENNAETAKLISKSLEREGHTVVWINSPDHYNAIDQFDALIVDYHSQQIEKSSPSLDFCRLVKKNGVNLPTILATEVGDKELLVEALRVGVRDFLLKDANFLDVLPAMVDRILVDTEIEQEHYILRKLRNHSLETHHRVKNSFQIVHSLLNLELRKHNVLDRSAVAKVVSHLQGLSLIHDILTENINMNRSGSLVSAQDLIERLVGILRNSDQERKINLRLDAVCVEARVASTLAIVVTELLINALKYGDKEVGISVKKLENNRALLKIENLVADFINQEKSPGLNSGSVLVEFLAKSDFKSKIGRGMDCNGNYFCELSFPIVKKSGDVLSSYNLATTESKLRATCSH